MKKFAFKKLDAFATNNSSGNPAGYVELQSFDDITDKEMLNIARELKHYVNEVGYVSRLDNDMFRLRYYSSEQEIEFCGHATVAIMYDIIKNDSKLLNQDEINIEINKEQLMVQNKIKQEDAVFITSPTPVYHMANISINDVANALDICSSNIINKPEIINGGLETLLVELDSLKTILGLKLDILVLKELCLKYGADIIEVFCAETTDTNNAYRTRVFTPKFGYLEDPATGSGNSALGYYLLKHKKWDGGIISIEQNGYLDSYNIVKLKSLTDSSSTIRVLFGGNAITRIEGQYFYP